ncbi:lipopolysaccharide assembly protein LapA domain-containing protein [Wenxinia marina]|uniref:Lipopolysaccharide assembly protein A domain-containing protein n=1 Tax=Wenxinia marina DSM 24838 TaxID=1123501 RepID=A0A0D0P7E8_9RHOB|nr:lipopolysaccharide assembly protein LapA domain-containing protein [Wenxinia marina]KIQ67511.1 hypothetical protein Wenmar_03936 [Wenxinia marina DSM 24838]GGL68910.1 phosphoribosylanthranilate isomerase [Wenxinia marina]
MRVIRIAFWALVALCLIVLGIANRDIVTLRALPEALAGAVGLSPDIQMPLFIAIFIGIAIGLLIGFVWEWIREHKHRSEARARRREVTMLEREVGRLRAEKHEGQDDVLALLDGTTARR